MNLRKFFSVFSLLVIHYFYAQINVQIIDNYTKQPIQNADIYCNNMIVGHSDFKGNINIKTPCDNFLVKAPGYYDEQFNIKNTQVITLESTTTRTKDIAEVVLSDKSDKRALEILRKVNQNYKKNSPKSLPSYSFKAYDKIYIDVEEDSLATIKAFIDKMPKSKDSLDDTFILKNRAFLWERAQEFMFAQEYGEKINILDNRISGFKNPIYELIALQSNRNAIPRQLREENRSLYRFFLTDTISIDERPTYVIRFREISDRSPKNKRKFNGYIYIDQQTFGIKKIERLSKNKNDGSLVSVWKLFHGKWFLENESIKLKIGSSRFSNRTDSTQQKKEFTIPTFGYLKASYFDYKVPITYNRKDFEGYTFSVKNTDGKLMESYRTDTLSQRDAQTYRALDSLGAKYNFDKKINLLTGLARGSFRVHSVDIPIDQILNYNAYEGFRLGLKLKLNENFHKRISPEAYFAYGFKDNEWKYGAAIDYRLSLERNSVLRAEYQNDVEASGEFNRRLWNFRLRVMNLGNNLNNDRYYKSVGGKLTYMYDVTNAFTMIVGLGKYREEALFNYGFRSQGNGFDNVKTQLTLKFSPNSTNIMTPQGKTTVEQRYPELYFNYEQGIPLLGGDLSYSRLDALFIQNFKSFVGTTGIRIYGGLTLGKTPIWNHFTMNGLASPNKSFNFNLTSFLGFATLEGGKYYTDKFVNLYFTHKIPWHFKTIGENISNFDVVWRGAIGNMKNPEYHNTNFQVLNRLYQEAGVEWNNFLGTKFNLGFFYRVGHYTSPKFMNNFAIQYKLKLLEF